MKTEDKLNRNYARGGARNRQRDHRGGKGTNGYDEEYPALKPSIERKGEIKYHAANEKRMREKAAQESDDDGWGWIGEAGGKADGQVAVKDNAGATEQPGPPTNQTSSIAPPRNPKSDPNYIPPHKRALQHRSRNEPEKPTKDVGHDGTEEELIDLQEDVPTETPPAPSRLMARIQMLDACEDDADGGVPLI